MLKVDLIYSNYLNSPDGASRFVKTMNGESELFAKYGIELRVITPDMFSHRAFENGSVEHPSLVKRIVRTLSKYSVVVTRMRIKRAYHLPSQRVLDYYDSLPEKGRIVAFQEGVMAYTYLKRHKDHEQVVLLTMHSNGEMWSTLAQSQPRINSFLMSDYRNDMETTLFTGCDKIGFVADFPRRHFCELYNYDVEKTFFVYNGNAPVSLIERAMPKTLDLICVGSLTKNKNQMGVLNAIAMLPEDYQKKVTFTIVGDGTERPSLEERARSLTAKVVFTGSSKEVDKYLGKANCYILFSKNEGLPMSIIEGMRAGLPIIGSRVGGIPEQIVDGESGFVVDVDEKQLAAKLKFLIDNLNLLPDMGKVSYNYYLEKFTIEAMVKAYSRLYSEAVWGVIYRLDFRCGFSSCFERRVAA